MFGILTRLQSFSKRLLFYYYQCKYPNADFGQNIVFNGTALLRLNKNSQVKLGNNITFNSKTKYNLAGIYKKCSVAVIEQARLTIGDNSGFSGVSIFCSKEIIIGSDVNCGTNVMIWDTDFHSINYIERRNNSSEGVKSIPIKIGSEVFIGGNSIILKGTEIGDNSVIAAGSVVRGVIPANEVWGGNPAKFIKKLS